jgi:glycosyltransferase involved in cell wall biosynthesis
MTRPTVSVVVPVYNESQNLGVLQDRLVPVLERASQGSFEILFVDDASDDGSGAILDSVSASDSRVKVIHFSRNFGHQAALQAGMDAARGDSVVLMDADLQDPPEVVEQFIERWRQGYEVVYAVRRVRKEGLLKRVLSAGFYRTLRAVAEIDIPVDAGDFCLMDRRVVGAIVTLPERNRYLRGLRSWVGFRQVGVEFDRDARHAGVPKYTVRSSMRLALTGYIGFSTVPLRLATWLGVLSALTGFLLTVWVILGAVVYQSTVRGWASILGAVLVLGGMQMLMLGIVGAYLSRVYDDVRQRPVYIIRARTGFDDEGRGMPDDVSELRAGR